MNHTGWKLGLSKKGAKQVGTTTGSPDYTASPLHIAVGDEKMVLLGQPNYILLLLVYRGERLSKLAN